MLTEGRLGNQVWLGLNRFLGAVKVKKHFGWLSSKCQVGHLTLSQQKCMCLFQSKLFDLVTWWLSLKGRPRSGCESKWTIMFPDTGRCLDPTVRKI